MLGLTDEEKELMNKCSEYLLGIQASPAHGLDHAEKVLGYALELAKGTGASRKALIASSLLHDVSRQFGGKGEGHGKESIKMVGHFLGKISLTEEELALTLEAISNHSLKEQGLTIPIESKILYDADKLAGFGMLGFMRICIYAGEQGYSFDEICDMLIKKLPRKQSQLHLEQSKVLAKELNQKLELIQELMREERIL
ncbi:HD domain-containing protein [Candidatus Woesearchaeota archaeon]|nr:HD domain-containing protein [Candidatus Woesearchaeota archaeon]